MSSEDYKLRLECAAELVHELISETNRKNEIISGLRLEIRQLKERLAAIRYNPYHDPKNGRFTSGEGTVLFVGKGQAGKGTYVFGKDDEYNSLQEKRLSRLQALVSSSRINSSEVKFKPEKQPVSVKDRQTSTFRIEVLAHHKNELVRLDKLKYEYEKQYNLGEISKAVYDEKLSINRKAYEHSQKIVREYSEAGELRSFSNRPIIAVDFDNTIAVTKFPKIISLNLNVAFFLRKAKENGATIILWTCRSDDDLWRAVIYCEEHGVPIDYVNENVPERMAIYGNDCRKISADIYIDDKNVCLDELATINSLQSEEKSGIMQEERFNPNHDEKGRFASGNRTSGTKYAPSPCRNSVGITVKPKTYAMLCGEFNTLYPNSRKGETGLISKGKYHYMAVSDGEGGIILHAKWKQK